MKTSELVKSLYRKATGKDPTFAVNTPKWTKAVGIANDLIDIWIELDDWFSLHDPEYSIGTVTATNTFDFDGDEVHKLCVDPTDRIRITHLDGNYTDYALVIPSQLKTVYKEGNYCARIGNTIRFNKTFAETDPQFGGAITAPVFLYPEKLTSSSSIVPVDIPQWVVLRGAAEWDRNDIVKRGEYDTIMAEAEGLLIKMRRNNEASQVSEVPIDMPPMGATW